VKYAALARGDAEIYLRFTLKGYREFIWNHAAGAIITTGMQIFIHGTYYGKQTKQLH